MPLHNDLHRASGGEQGHLPETAQAGPVTPWVVRPRGGGANRWDAAVQVAAGGTPAFDHPPAAGSRVGVCRSPQTPHAGARVPIMDTTVAPESPAAPPHIHEGMDEAFYILEGTLVILAGSGGPITAGAGTFVFVLLAERCPRGVLVGGRYPRVIHSSTSVSPRVRGASSWGATWRQPRRNRSMSTVGMAAQQAVAWARTEC